MGFGKWIGGYLGFVSAGPLGAIVGFIVGALFDSMTGSVSFQNEYEYQNYEEPNQSEYSRQQQYEGQRNSFLISLLTLASYVIKADGKVMHSEMELVRQFLRQNFGEIAVQQGEDIILRLFDHQKQVGEAQFRSTIRSACQQIAQNMDYSQRLQLLNFLVMIAQADGNVHPKEIEAIKEIGQSLHISQQDIDSMLNLRGSANDLDAAYKVLGISKDATDDEVKAAYRKMALKHHPDKVATLGEDVKKAAEKKFQEINDAKDKIYKARGL
jgi:DnaJ like chaperone protein